MESKYKEIKKRLPWGSNRKIAQMTGLDEGYVSGILNGARKSKINSPKIWEAALSLLGLNSDLLSEKQIVRFDDDLGDIVLLKVIKNPPRRFNQYLIWYNTEAKKSGKQPITEAMLEQHIGKQIRYILSLKDLNLKAGNN